MKEDKIVEYILVNKELSMGIGKIAGQVAHVQTIIDNHIKHYSDTINRLESPAVPAEWKYTLECYEHWFTRGSQTKVILKGKEKDLLKAIEMGAFEVRDNGLTEILANSLTVVGFFPQHKSNLVQFTKKFQLL